MKKQNNVKKLGKPKGQRDALIRSQVKDLLLNGHIKTTKARAGVVASRVDALMAFVEEKNEKKLSEYLVNKDLIKKVLSYNTNGKKSGYASMRTVKNRPGDNAELVLVELLLNK